jgi:hypothetical protein
MTGHVAAVSFMNESPHAMQEVKVMKCWRCKQFGHRTGDRECPLFLQGNLESDARRQVL